MFLILLSTTITQKLKEDLQSFSVSSKKRNRKKKKKNISKLLLSVFVLCYNIIEKETGINVEEDNNVIGKLSVIE